MGTSANLSKCDGLLLIDRYGLPHPDWRFGEKPDDFPDTPWIRAQHGWTVRCAPTRSYAFALPASHRLPYREVRNVVEAYRRDISDHMFVVYPSWEFDIAGGLLIDWPEIYVEVVRGDISALLRGRRSPDAIYSIEGLSRSCVRCIGGDATMLEDTDRVIFTRAVNSLREEDDIVFEWSKTTEARVLFHDCSTFR